MPHSAAPRWNGGDGGRGSDGREGGGRCGATTRPADRFRSLPYSASISSPIVFLTLHDGSLVTSKLIHNESFFNEGPLVWETDISSPTITLYLSSGEWGRHTPISTCHLCWHHDLLDLKNRMNFG